MRKAILGIAAAIATLAFSLPAIAGARERLQCFQDRRHDEAAAHAAAQKSFDDDHGSMEAALKFLKYDLSVAKSDYEECLSLAE
ncbi:MAG TPA: hypothetical protein VGP28_04320 [Methylocella sp.]|jgi:hypothetical protein|nr:hypothetical protein [Methylocella sp.]